MTDTNLAARRYVHFVLRQLAISPGRLAKMARVSPSTLTRFMNSPDHKFNLSVTTLERIAEATNISPSQFFAQTRRFRAAGQNDEALKKAVVVIGEIAPGVWKEHQVYEDPLLSYPLHLTTSYFAADECFACVIKGESANKVALPGDFILCALWDAYLVANVIEDGNLVVIERQKDDGNLFELSVRSVRHSKEGHELHFPSTDRRFQSLLKVGDLLKGDNHNVKVLGVVLWVVKDVWNMAV